MKNIGIIKTDKFKNNAISLVIPVGLEENVTGYNVMAQLMKRRNQGIQFVLCHRKISSGTIRCGVRHRIT